MRSASAGPLLDDFTGQLLDGLSFFLGHLPQDQKTLFIHSPIVGSSQRKGKGKRGQGSGIGFQAASRRDPWSPDP